MIVKLYALSIMLFGGRNWAIPENIIPYYGRLLGFPKGRGGSRLWNSEGMEGGGGVFTIGYPKALVNSTGGISGVESVE